MKLKNKNQIFIFLLLFLGLRLISYNLSSHLILQSLLTFLIVITLGYAYYRSPKSAFAILLTELLLGGSGQLLELYGLSLRTVLLVTFITLWFGDKLLTKKPFSKHLEKKQTLIIFGLLSFVALFWIIGAINNSFLAATQDFIPYLYLLIIFPATELFEDKKLISYSKNLLIAFIIGTTIFSLYNFVVFSTGWEIIHDPYYKWIRDVLAGKITDTGTGFFRIVEPIHLLLVPVTLGLAAKIMKNNKHKMPYYILVILSLFTLVLNLSRTYFLGLILGFIILAYRQNLKKWFKISTSLAGLTIFLFFSTHLLASGFASFGLELISNRFGSIVSPSTELSTYTRSALLTPAIDLIKQSPLYGHGLGSSITFFAPNPDGGFSQITTRQFDWGYLEILAEMGVIGMGVLLFVLLYLIYKLLTIHHRDPNCQFLEISLVASLFAMILMNITAPIIFHLFGISFFVYAFTISTEKHSFVDVLVDRITGIL